MKGARWEHGLPFVGNVIWKDWVSMLSVSHPGSFSVLTERTCSDHKSTLVPEWVCSCGHALTPCHYPHGILDVSVTQPLWITGRVTNGRKQWRTVYSPFWSSSPKSDSWCDGLAISLLTRLFLYKLYMNLLLRNIPEYVLRTLYL